MTLYPSFRCADPGDDYLEVSETRGAEDTVLSRLCGYSVPGPLLVPLRDVLRISFRSGADRAATGFLARYAYVIPVPQGAAGSHGPSDQGLNPLALDRVPGIFE